MCGIVLADPRNSFVELEPMNIYGAMLGNLGISLPFDPEAGAFDSERATQEFLSGGKMVRYKQGQAIAPQNTTISAICVLGYVNENLRRFRIRVAQLQHETGSSGTPESIRPILVKVHETHDAFPRHLRIQVYENPCAVRPLVKAFVPWSPPERFGLRNGHFCRVFVGPSLAALEADERASGVERSDPLGLQRG